MALVKCNECGREISGNACRCPNCGAPPRKRTSLFTWFVAILFGLWFLGYCLNNDTADSTSLVAESPSTESTKPTLFSSENVVTKAMYDELRIGMSYYDATQTIGKVGEEMSRNKIEGVPGVMESIETVMYMWKNNNGSNMNAIFQNNRLMQKAQFGLK